jgi:hypothetical protein
MRLGETYAEALGKGGVKCSIHFGGTIYPP